MSRLKQTQRSLYTKILDSTYQLQDSMSLSLARRSSPLVENLGRTLLSLKLLVIITAFLVVTFTLSLWLPIKMTWMRLLEQFSFIETLAWNVQSILCRWVDAVKNIPSMFKKSQTSVWKEDGDSAQDSTYHYSEMHGGPKTVYMNKQHERAMTAPITKGRAQYDNTVKDKEPDLDIEKRAREAGL